jgi:hypothetical protein
LGRLTVTFSRRAQLLRSGEVSDPLLQFSGQLESGALEGISETVNLLPLFTCQGAASDAMMPAGDVRAVLGARLRNADVAASLARAAGWVPLVSDPSLRTGILLLRAERAATRSRRPVEIREAFYERGVALTAYEGGLIRLSMPEVPWQPGEVEHLGAALRSVS